MQSLCQGGGGCRVDVVQLPWICSEVEEFKFRRGMVEVEVGSHICELGQQQVLTCSNMRVCTYVEQ